MKHRTQRGTRFVDKTVGDKTHRVPQEYDRTVPVVPRDWDEIALRTVRAGTTLSVLGAMTWATVAIGALLSMTAPAWVAYTVAGVFDLAWVVCMLLEWLAKHDPERAKLPRRAGWAALVISMSLITVHGGLLDLWAVGAGGALVSFIAKSMWSVVMNFTAVELDPETREWLKAERREVGAEQALTHERRSLARTQSVLALEKRTLGLDVPVVRLDTPAVPRDSGQRVPVGTAPSGPGGVHVQSPVPPPVPVLSPDSVSGTVLSLLMNDPAMSGTDIRTSVLSVLPTASEDSIAKAITRGRKRINP